MQWWTLVTVIKDENSSGYFFLNGGRKNAIMRDSNGRKEFQWSMLSASRLNRERICLVEHAKETREHTREKHKYYIINRLGVKY